MGEEAAIPTAAALGALERRAREILPTGVYDFFAGGAGSEATVVANAAAWAELELRPRVLRDVSAVDLSVDLLGARLAAPIVVAPMAAHRLAHPDGELATARAVAAAGGLLVISTRAGTTLADIAAAAPTAHRWFQVYLMRDRGWTAELAAEARATGCSALVLTVDTPVVGTKLRASQAAFEIPAEVWMVNRSGRTSGAADAEEQDASIGLDAIAWLHDVSGAFRWSSRGWCEPTMRAPASTPARRRSWSPTTVAGSWTAPLRRRGRCLRSWKRRRAGSTSMSTAGCAVEPTSCVRSRSAPAR